MQEVTLYRFKQSPSNWVYAVQRPDQSFWPLSIWPDYRDSKGFHALRIRVVELRCQAKYVSHLTQLPMFRNWAWRNQREPVEVEAAAWELKEAA